MNLRAHRKLPYGFVGHGHTSIPATTRDFRLSTKTQVNASLWIIQAFTSRTRNRRTTQFSPVAPARNSVVGAHGHGTSSLLKVGMQFRQLYISSGAKKSTPLQSYAVLNTNGGDITAERRMFAKTIIDSDAFLDMPMSTQCLYFHLAMRADDDGFLNNPKKVQRMIGASEDDLKVLLGKKFLIAFESGVVVIKHWKIHNYIRNDRYKPTVYEEEKAKLKEKENGSYTLGIPDGIPDGYRLDTQVRLGKDRIELGKDRLELEESDADKPPRTRFTPPSVQDVRDYCIEKGYHIDAERFCDYYISNGWMVGRNKMKDWRAAVRTWAKKDNQQEKKTSNIFLQMLEDEYGQTANN